MPKKLHTDLKKRVYDTLLEWEAPDRTWEPRSQQWYVFYGAFFIVLIAAFAIWQEYLLIMATVAFVFLWFIQAAIPPEIATYSVTSLGVKAYGKLYKWADVEHFWFSQKNDWYYLHIDVLKGGILEDGRRQRITIIIDESLQHSLFDHLINFIDYGDKDEVQFNILTRIINGSFVDINTFLDTKDKVKGKEEDSKP